MKILAIETSCDETAVAIVDDNRNILSNLVFSQIDIHSQYGGVVPEIASRNHIEHIVPLMQQSLQEANIKNFQEFEAIASTGGPGLIGGVLVGVMIAKTLSSINNKPFIAVNHLEGHALTPRLVNKNLEFPFLLLLVSGGHCQILIAEGVGKYKKLGGTIDDALGEAFDKVAKLLEMDYPGGPEIEKNAKYGNCDRFIFPKPICNQKNCNFSFSGLKTAVFREVEKIKLITKKSELSQQDKYDICASFQYTVLKILKNRLNFAIQEFREYFPNLNKYNLVVSGGVAANQYLSKNLAEFMQQNNFNYFSPPINLCTDNAAMIAWAAIERYKLGFVDDLSFCPKARWSLGDS